MSQFKPESRLAVTTTVTVTLNFPVKRISTVLHAIDQRENSKEPLLSDLIEDIEIATEDIGEAVGQSAGSSLASLSGGNVTLEFVIDKDTSEQALIDAIESASQKFWERHCLDSAPEVMAILDTKPKALKF